MAFECLFKLPHRLIKQSPITPSTKPISFFTVSFSLKAKTEPIHTKIIPRPLNKGNKSTDGTLPERLVITKLIIQRESALPKAQIKIKKRLSNKLC